MPTWTVTDSRGKCHEVTADKMHRIGTERVFRDSGDPLDTDVAAFCEPVSVMPKRGKPALIPPLAFLAKIWRKYT